MLLKSGPDAPKLEKMVLYLSQDGHTDKQRWVQTDAQIDQKIKDMFRNSNISYTLKSSYFHIHVTFKLVDPQSFEFTAFSTQK